MTFALIKFYLCIFFNVQCYFILHKEKQYKFFINLFLLIIQCIKPEWQRLWYALNQNWKFVSENINLKHTRSEKTYDSLCRQKKVKQHINIFQVAYTNFKIRKVHSGSSNWKHSCILFNKITKLFFN